MASLGSRKALFVLAMTCSALLFTASSLQGQDPAERIIKRSSSLISVSPSGNLLAVVNPDSNSVSILEIHNELELIAEVSVGVNPGTVTFSLDNTSIYVTSQSEDSLYKFGLSDSLDGHASTTSIGLLDEPFGVITSPDSEHIYVAESGSGTLAVIDANSLGVIDRIELGGNPRGLAITESGDRLYVTDFFTGQLSVIDTHTRQLVSQIELVDDSNISMSVILNEPETFAFLPVTRTDTANQDLTFETTVFPSVSIVDLNADVELENFRMDLDEVDKPVSIPIDAVIGNGLIYVLNASSNDISVINLATFEREGHIPTGEHPRGIAISQDGTTLFVNNTLEGTVNVIDAASFKRLSDIAVTEIPLDEEILLGKILFNSADQDELAKNQWISCAVCHFDGGMDGRTWFFEDGPRNTTSLFGVKETLPIHWSGDLDELADVESTIRTIQAGTGLVDAEEVCVPSCDQSEPLAGRSRELDALVAYIETLNLPENPNLTTNNSELAVIERGQQIFLSDETGCSACHNAPLYTDLMRHDVGTATSELEMKGSSFDTPSLRGIYGTAPYLHDGSAKSLLDVLTTKNLDDMHGTTSQLLEEEIDALILFLLTL